MRCRNFISFDTFECLALEIYELTESISQPTLSNQQETDYWLEALSVYLLGSALQISSHTNWNALLALTCLSYLLVIQKSHMRSYFEWMSGWSGMDGWRSGLDFFHFHNFICNFVLFGMISVPFGDLHKYSQQGGEVSLGPRRKWGFSLPSVIVEVFFVLEFYPMGLINACAFTLAKRLFPYCWR